MRHTPAAMMHGGGGGGVLFMMTTKFASQERNKRKKIKKNIMESPFVTTISVTKQQRKVTSNIHIENKQQNQRKHQWQPTPCSIKHTYR